MPKKIAVVLSDRCNYGRMKPVMQAIKDHPELELLLICTGTMVLERFGRVVDVCRADGFRVDAEIYAEVEGSVPASMTKSIGLTLMEVANSFNLLKPDVLLVIGDRYETLGVVMTAVYMGICVAHIQGGEVSGSLDESARHAITKMAHYHFPSTKRAAEYLIRMGERPDTVFMVGCPVCDIAFNLDTSFEKNPFENRGLGGPLDITKPYLLVIFHPDTCAYGQETEQVQALVRGLETLGIQTCWLWANIDSGGDHINQYLRRTHEYDQVPWIQFVKNFEPETYQRILANAACAVGNSSSFVRDSTCYGTPVVLVGDRQKGREKGENAVCVQAEKDAVIAAVQQQVDHGKYERDVLYGDGSASQQIVEKLVVLEGYPQKRLAYVEQSEG